MTDREPLELAAKAAGIDAKRLPHAWPERFDDDQWDPLIDDGDAFRLMVDLSIEIEVMHPRDERELGRSRGNQVWQLHGNDPRAATRRAIVRAAAEIGRDMK